MKTTIGHLIEWSASNYPNKTGLVDWVKGQRWTFAQWDDEVNRMANLLLELGVNKGDVVSVFLYNRSEFVTTSRTFSSKTSTLDWASLRMNPNSPAVRR